MKCVALRPRRLRPRPGDGKGKPQQSQSRRDRAANWKGGKAKEGSNGKGVAQESVDTAGSSQGSQRDQR